MDIDRGIARAVATLIFLGSLVMWIGIPLGWVWAVSQLADHYPTVYAGALFGCPVTMVLFGLLLARLNAFHLRLTGGYGGRGRTAWLKSLSDTRRRARGPRRLIDVSMTASAWTALVLMLVWFFFFAQMRLITP